MRGWAWGLAAGAALAAVFACGGGSPVIARGGSIGTHRFAVGDYLFDCESAY